MLTSLKRRVSNWYTRRRKIVWTRRFLKMQEKIRLLHAKYTVKLKHYPNVCRATIDFDIAPLKEQARLWGGTLEQKEALLGQLEQLSLIGTHLTYH